MVEIFLNLKENLMGSDSSKSFNSEQVTLIQNILDETSLNGCLPKKILFECVLEHKSEMFPMELYEFELLITKAIRSKTITGYDIRQGRGGGICREGFFTEKDSIIKNKTLSITFKNKTFKISPSKKKFLSFIINSGSEGENGEGNLFINNKLYSIPESIDTFKFLEEILNQ